MNPVNPNPASSVDALMVFMERAYGLRLENPERCIEHSRTLLEQAQDFHGRKAWLGATLVWRNF